MAGWIETYRGTVPPWQCDITEHFTIAYYFDRLEDAEANFAEAFGLGELLRGGGFARRLDLRFARELRAGSSFQVESAPLGLDEGGLRLGHRFVDSFTGETVTWIDETWEIGGPALSGAERDAIAGRLAAWEGPAAETRPQPTSFDRFIPTARGRVKRADTDAAGRFGLAAIVHRFTDACIQAGAAIGMTAEWLHANRRGFSTFELALRLAGELRLDEAYLVQTGIAHLGNSSVRFIHRMTNPATGREIARLGQYGVNLDLDARRPAKIPDELRERAAVLTVPVE
jgi:acyl-CoA thioesterase FadM